MPAARQPNLHVTLGLGGKGDPLELANPVIAASGAFGAGIEVATVASFARLGAFVIPAIGRGTRRRIGGPWFTEATAGLLLQGPYPTLSYRRALRDWAPAWRSWTVPLIANVPAADIDEAVETAEALFESDLFAALELDCTGLIGQEAPPPAPALVARAVATVQRAWHGVLIAKLPYAAETADLALAAARAGADAIALGGGLPALVPAKPDAATLPSRDHVGAPPAAARPLRTGRLVGPATLPLALPIVQEVAAAGGLPLIASGGISSAEDALAFLRCGATAVQIGSAALVDPRIPATVADGLAAVLTGPALPH